MKILVIGGGGREHAVVWKLSQSKRVSKIYCAPGNGGISKLAECVDISSTDIESVVDFAKSKKIDLCVVTPDNPLVMGMVDALEKEGIRAFGPGKDAALIEGSKVFAKKFMTENGIPTAKYKEFSSPEEAVAYLEKCSFPQVIKADGLALGKGVIIAENFQDSVKAVKSIMEEMEFGSSGQKIVIEEFLKGEEITVLAFTDGNTIYPMISARDYKRAFDGNLGLNTGGMGAYSQTDFYTPEDEKFCMERIYRPTIEALNRSGRKFKGVLYFGLMKTSAGIFVIEYNSRFGDPETQVILPCMETDLLDIFEAVIDERLSEIKVRWSGRKSVCVVLASGGYPKEYETGKQISGLRFSCDNMSIIDVEECADYQDVVIFHAGTKFEDGILKTSGGRVLCVVGLGKTTDEARSNAYGAVSKISFENMHFRKDIADGI